MTFIGKWSVVPGALWLASAVALAQGAVAAAPPPVASSLAVQRIVVGADGKDAAQPAANARPGDVLEYAAVWRSSAAVRQLEPTLPIPVGTAFVPGSAKPAAVRASLDGATYAPLPLKRKVRQADGKEVEQAVPIAEIRFLRWQPQDLAAGASAGVSARVRVIADAPIVASAAVAPVTPAAPK